MNLFIHPLTKLLKHHQDHSHYGARSKPLIIISTFLGQLLSFVVVYVKLLSYTKEYPICQSCISFLDIHVHTHLLSILRKYKWLMVFELHNSHERLRQNFSLKFLYNINQMSDENKEKYQCGDNNLFQD